MFRLLLCIVFIVQFALAQTSRFSVAEKWQPYVSVSEQRDSFLAWSFNRALSFGNLSPARFCSVDKLADKFPGWSPYTYATCNPIVFVDANGDSAWTINNLWNQQTIAGYQQYTRQRAQQLAQNGATATCEDFALQVLIDYASTNGLPLAIANGSGTFSAASDQFTDVAGFANTVLTTTGAPDLQNPTNTVGVDVSKVNAGDLLLTRDNGVTANHVQLVTSVSGNSMTIYQGNMNFWSVTGGIARSLWNYQIPHLGDSRGPGYAGVPVTRGTIYFNSGNSVYVNRSTGNIIPNYFDAKNIEARAWNFGGW